MNTPNLAKSLRYFSYVGYNLGREYDYTPPVGGFVANSEAEYNAIVWNETDPNIIPSYWSLWLDNGIKFIAAQWADAQVAGEGFPALVTTVAGLSAGTRTTSAFTLNPSGTGATGTQVHATKASSIQVTYSTQITYSLSGSPASSVVVKVCPTNSSTEANWVEIGRTEIGQPTGLAVTVGQVVKNVGQVTADVDAGYYVKAVASGAGTHTETFIAGQKTIYG